MSQLLQYGVHGITRKKELTYTR
ncbi:hypothetical protein OCT59_011467 [Rhizophagus irregularis]|nr:hypothetical protein OCT59_011467 [Rhizophagus irregularis]